MFPISFVFKIVFLNNKQSHLMSETEYTVIGKKKIISSKPDYKKKPSIENFDFRLILILRQAVNFGI